MTRDSSRCCDSDREQNVFAWKKNFKPLSSAAVSERAIGVNLRRMQDLAARRCSFHRKGTFGGISP